NDGLRTAVFIAATGIALTALIALNLQKPNTNTNTTDTDTDSGTDADTTHTTDQPQTINA
ncbi:hypothetical protein AB0L85_32995, partial [Streptomyces sp. NPDC052051]|uniref:hypothetical protein n=1 Tax=Streptomyces sp. NPDC052051 TaxID=3154649 RepID=UPI00342474BE